MPTSSRLETEESVCEGNVLSSLPNLKDPLGRQFTRWTFVKVCLKLM